MRWLATLFAMVLLLVFAVPTTASGAPPRPLDSSVSLTASHRAQVAQQRQESKIRTRLDQLALSSSSVQVFFRILKEDARFEVWVSDATHPEFQLYQSWTICAASGNVGPKRVSGDLQVPEGYYVIDRFNPASAFYLSIGLDYPNRADRFFSDPQRPGGDIFIHGGCASIGCIALTDAVIEQVYVLAALARRHGQVSLPVLIVPTQLDHAGLDALKRRFAGKTELLHFWHNLAAIDQAFLTTRRPPPRVVTDHGRYWVDLNG